MMVPFTEFSRTICRGLHIEDFEYRFVESDYEAEMFGRSFRIEHNIPGFLERDVPHKEVQMGVVSSAGPFDDSVLNNCGSRANT